MALIYIWGDIMSIFDTKCTTNIDLANRLKEVATNYKTLYVMGCFGAPMNDSNKKRYCNNHDYNKNAARTAMIQAATADTFGFDCVCLIKSLLWGWNGNVNAIYGGAYYKSNDVPDVSANGMIKLCKDVTTDFSNIEIGEAVWMEGHIGVYVGGGLAVECTPKWSNNVQLTACNQAVSGYNRRNWTKHGKLPYIEYLKEEKEEPKPVEQSFGILDEVKIREGVNTYANGKTMPNWLLSSKLYVRELQGEKIVISTLKEGAITGVVWAKDLVPFKELSGAETSTEEPTNPEASEVDKPKEEVTTTPEKTEEFSDNWIKQLLIRICEFLLKALKK